MLRAVIFEIKDLSSSQHVRVQDFAKILNERGYVKTNIRQPTDDLSSGRYIPVVDPFQIRKQNPRAGHTPRICTLPAANVQILFPSREGRIVGQYFNLSTSASVVPEKDVILLVVIPFYFFFRKLNSETEYHAVHKIKISDHLGRIQNSPVGKTLLSQPLHSCLPVTFTGIFR